MRGLRMRVLVFAVVLAAAAVAAAARDHTSLQAEFWMDVQPMGASGPAAAPSDDEALRVLLEEARQVFSGMIYGYSFRWRPADPARQTAEQFVLEPLGEIAWGDSDLECRETRGDGASRWLRVRYFTKAHEQARLESWASLPLAAAGGHGEASYFDGPTGKSAALEAAFRDALRSHARGLTRNRPAWVEGRFVIDAVPVTGVVDGRYQANVRIRIAQIAVDGYRSY